MIAGVKERQNIAMSNSVSLRPVPDAKPPIRAWRIVGGAFLHFAVPAYVLCVAVITLLNAPARVSLAELARLALGYSGWFLAGYVTMAIAATTVAAAIEPALELRRHRHLAHDSAFAATASRLRLTHALAEARGLPGADVHRLLDSIGGPRWDHDDPRFQALSNDLTQVVHAMSTANATASDQSRPDIIDLATRSLRGIDDALATLAAERGRLDHGDARTVTRYVENRYGPSDFAGS